MSERIMPGVSIEVLDGKLTDNVAITADTVLVVDRSYKGPVGTVYKVTSSSAAAIIFGSDSPIIKKMGQAFAGGAKNVALYRVGGSVASIDNVFGLATGLSTVEASDTASQDIKVYIGPEPTNPQLQTVIAKVNSNIVYSNTTEGSIDLNKVYVDGFDKQHNEIQLGSFQEYVPFEEISKNIGARVIITAQDVKEVEIPSTDLPLVSKYGVMIKVNGNPVKATTDFTTGKVTFDTKETTFTVELSYIKRFTEDELKDKEIVQKTGESLVNSSWKQYYEAFDSALKDIQDLSVRAVFVGDVFNPPNIADGSTDKDRLEYVRVTEDDFGERIYEWSVHKKLYRKGTGTTEDPALADLTTNGIPIVAKQFNEVDFVHRAGMWGFERTTNGTYPNIVVGALPPKALNSKYINLWVGRSPVYDSLGHMTTNGTGLQGHRLMVGTTTRSPGYFATGSGFPDGDVVSDSGGVAVDLGKYLSIVVNQVTSTSGLVASAGANYAGLITNVNPGDGTTNQVLPGCTVVTELKQSQINTLQALGFVVLQTKNKGVTVISGNLATQNTSDYKYLSTAVVMNALVEDINQVAEPFIGKGIDGISKVALHTALNARLALRQQQGYYIGYAMTISQTAPNVLKIAHVIQAKDELRQVFNTVELTRSTV